MKFDLVSSCLPVGRVRTLSLDEPKPGVQYVGTVRDPETDEAVMELRLGAQGQPIVLHLPSRRCWEASWRSIMLLAAGDGLVETPLGNMTQDQINRTQNRLDRVPVRSVEPHG